MYSKPRWLDTPVNNAKLANEPKSESRYNGVFTKALEILGRLPPVYIDDKSVSTVVKSLVNKEYWRAKWILFKANPMNIIETPLFTDVQESIIGVCSDLSEVIGISKYPICNSIIGFARNAALIDAITKCISNKMQPSFISSLLSDFKAKLTEHHLETDITKYTDIQSCGVQTAINVFVSSISVSYEIGDEFELYIPNTWFFRTSNATMNMAKAKLLYKSFDVDDQLSSRITGPARGSHENLGDRNGCVIVLRILLPEHENLTENDKYDYVYVFCDVISEGTKKYLGCSGSVYSATTGCRGAENTRFQNLSLCAIKPRYTSIFITSTSSTIELSKRTYSSSRLIKTKETRDIIERVKQSVKLGYSRGYALVGYPGTGKTQVVSQILDEFPESFVLEVSPKTFNDIESISEVFSRIPGNHLIIFCDDFEKNGKMDDKPYVQALISMFERMHQKAKHNGKVFTLIATINDPTIVANSIIKRSGRIDEVIKIDIPSSEFISDYFNRIRSEDDSTDYSSFRYRMLFKWLRHKNITIADLKNIYESMRISKKTKEGYKLTYTIRDMKRASDLIVSNKLNAEQNYAL